MLTSPRRQALEGATPERGASDLRGSVRFESNHREMVAVSKTQPDVLSLTALLWLAGGRLPALAAGLSAPRRGGHITIINRRALLARPLQLRRVTPARR